jgi:hypothetical protein
MIKHSTLRILCAFFLLAAAAGLSAQTPVTFQVHLGGQVVDPDGAFLAGSFNNWSDMAMTPAGNGLWTATVSLAPGQSYQYKFKNGPGGWENVTAECGVDDGFGGFNRQVTVGTVPITLPVVSFGSCALNCAQNPMAIICDDFESYTLGPVSPQATWWVPWLAADNSSLSADVSDEEASNGTKSMKVKYDVQGSVIGDDQILLLGEETAGNYELKWKMYVPSEHAAYFNIQNTEVPGTTWNLEAYLDSNGIARVDLNSTTAPGLDFTFEFPFDEWFEVRFTFDLDNNLAKMYIGGEFIHVWPYNGNLGGIDYYAATTWDLYYVDELEYIELPPVVFNVDLCGGAIDLTQYFPDAQGVPTVTPLYSNATATVDATDPLPTCFEDAPAALLNNSVWFTFTGDGGVYDIETVECTAGADYIDDGDTQLAIYTGDCGALTEVACNEDIDFDNNDYRAGVFEFETVSGVDYRILIDGWSGPSVISTGAFCLQITKAVDVECSAGAVGDVSTTNNGFICPGEDATAILEVDPSGFVLPTVGPAYGMAWAVTLEPVGPGEFPADVAGYLGSTGLITSVFEIGGFNNVNFEGAYYLTPVVVAGAIDTDPTTPAYLHDLDLTSACFFVGESQFVYVVPVLDPIVAIPVITDPTGGQNNGAIELVVEGGLPQIVGDTSVLNYTFQWEGPNGFTSTEQNIDNLASGIYTVTISDPSGCIEPVIISNVTVAAPDPAIVTALQLSPNPTAGIVALDLVLGHSAEVRIDVVNALGQVVERVQAGRVTTLRQPLDLTAAPGGTYFVRVVIDAETAVRRVVVQH